MMFRGMKVWLHVDDDQQPVVKNNKVLIKYQIGQEHEYWVREKAVEPIDPARLKKKALRKRPAHDPSSAGKPEHSHDSFPEFYR